MDDRERDLQESVDELTETLEALRSELQEPPRGPLGVPRPPTPGELLRFTERYSIPALISLLETAIRTLELLAAAIRIAEGRPLDGHSGRGRAKTPTNTDRLASASRRTLEALDDALAEVQSAAAGGEPDDPELRGLLEEARSLRTEVDEQLAEATAETSDDEDGVTPVDIEVEAGDDRAESEDAGDAEDAEDDADRIDVDVEGELESIKRELDDPNRNADVDAGSDSDSDSESDAGDDEDMDSEGPGGN